MSSPECRRNHYFQFCNTPHVIMDTHKCYVITSHIVRAERCMCDSADTQFQIPHRHNADVH